MGVSFLLFTLQLFAQGQANITVFGRVTDAAGNPITGVYVKDTNSAAISVSDIRGIYRLSIKPKPTIISFNYIGFKTVRKTISAAAIKKAVSNEIVMDVQMEQQTFRLPGVDISGKPFEWVYQNPNAWVVDFDFVSDTTILLLMIEKHRHFLRLIDDKNKVLTDFNVHVKDANFFKDCFGNIHILTKDSAYQVYIYDSLGIYIYPAVSRQLFISKLYPCVYADDESLLLKRYGAFQQSLFLVKVNKNNKQRWLLYSEVNEKNLAIDEDLASEIIQYEKDKPEIDTHYLDEQKNSQRVGDLDYDPREGFVPTNDISDEKIAGLQYSLYLYSRPVQMDVFDLNDSIYVIDHFNCKLKVFKSDTVEQRSLDIDKNKFDLLHSGFYSDYRRRHIYIMSVSDGIAYLQELNPTDMSIKKEFKISEHIFPQKVKIRGNYVYYLYGGVINDGEKYLYREKIIK